MLSHAQLQQSDRLHLADHVPLDSPFTLYVEPISTCNFRCGYCPVSYPDYLDRVGKHRLSLDRFENLVSQIAELPQRLKVMYFHCLGEPLLNRDLPAMVTLAVRRRLADRFMLVTNGSLLSGAMAEGILASGIDHVRISIYGHDQASHEEV